MAEDLVEHLEGSLGPIATGWSEDAAGEPLGVQVAQFREVPAAGASTYSTLGMSRVPLRLNGRADVRLELLMACWDNQFDPQLVAVLAELALRITDDGVALRRGDVVRLADPVVSGSAMTSLYASNPAYFPEGLAEFEGTQPPTVVVWFVPLWEEEAQFVRVSGWDRFEDALERADPDLLDLRRKPIRLGGGT